MLSCIALKLFHGGQRLLKGLKHMNVLVWSRSSAQDLHLARAQGTLLAGLKGPYAELKL